MLTREPTPEMYHEWKLIWSEYKDRLRPDRKSGQALLNYLFRRYPLTEIFEREALDTITFNVLRNQFRKEKLPAGSVPVPRAFFLKNSGQGEVYYKPENKDSPEVWGGGLPKIFVGADCASGYFMVEGSTLLWDSLYAYQGIDEADIKNPCRVAEYIACLKRFDMLRTVLCE